MTSSSEAQTDRFDYQSGALRLSARAWLQVAVLVLLVLMLTPRLWRILEKPGFSDNYRMPYESSHNYWMFSRWADEAKTSYPVVMVGDSAIWGHYVDMDSTLAARLNEASGKKLFANLSVDGLHPVAMYGLLRYHGRSVRNTAVMLHLNPLWMSSPQHDLQVDEKVRFNHPDLVPQVFPDIPAYHPSLPDIIGVLKARHLLFLQWLSHIQQTCFEGMDLFHWSVMHPLALPCGGIDFAWPRPQNRPRSNPLPWGERGIPREQKLEWVSAENSLQWEFFRKTIGLLQGRGNTVFVLVGPFNTHLLSGDNLTQYNGLLDGIVTWLNSESGVSYHVAALPSSSQWADASHPLARGYEFVAADLMASLSFRDWIKASDRSSDCSLNIVK